MNITSSGSQSYFTTSKCERNFDDDIIGHRYKNNFPEPVVRVAIWRINREVVHGQSAVSGDAAPMLHVLSSLP